MPGFCLLKGFHSYHFKPLNWNKKILLWCTLLCLTTVLHNSPPPPPSRYFLFKKLQIHDTNQYDYPNLSNMCFFWKFILWVSGSKKKHMVEKVRSGILFGNYLLFFQQISYFALFSSKKPLPTLKSGVRSWVINWKILSSYVPIF